MRSQSLSYNKPIHDWSFLALYALRYVLPPSVTRFFIKRIAVNNVKMLKKES